MPEAVLELLRRSLWPHLYLLNSWLDLVDQGSVCWSQEQGYVVRLFQLRQRCSPVDMHYVPNYMVQSAISSCWIINMFTEFGEGSLYIGLVKIICYLKHTVCLSTLLFANSS